MDSVQVFLLSFIGTWFREETKSDLIYTVSGWSSDSRFRFEAAEHAGNPGHQGLKTPGNYNLSRRHADREFEFGLM